MLKTATGGVTLAYDPMLRLYDVTGAATTRFAYDGLDPSTGSGQAMIAEYDGSNALQRRFVQGPAVDEPLVQYEGTGTTDRRWLHADERGSIIAVSDAAGNVTTINRYDEFGKPQATNAGRFQYTGQMWLGELGLYHYKARAYAPHLGRFLQTDPIGYEGGMNAYAYVGNDPIGKTDIHGERGLTNGERRMLSKYFGPGLLSYISRIESPTFGFITRQFIDFGRSHIVPGGILFSGSDYRYDYSKFDSIRGSIKEVFLHEFYHHFEIAIGISSFRELLALQARSQITGEKLYTYDPTKSFLDNTPEARANAFARCVTYGTCSDVGNQRIPIDGTTFFRIGPGGITVYAIVTGSRIPRPISFPIKIK